MILKKLIPVFIASMVSVCSLSAMDPLRNDHLDEIIIDFEHLQGHRAPITSLAGLLLDDKKLIISGSFDGTVRVWDLENKKCLCVLAEHTGAIHSVSVIEFDAQKFIVSGSADGSIKFWNPKKGTCSATLKNSVAGIIKIEPTDDAHITSLSADGQIIIWNIADKRPEEIFNHMDAQFLSYGNKFLLSASANNVKVWSLHTHLLKDKIFIPATCTDEIVISHKICGLINIINEPRFFVSTVAPGHEQGCFAIWDWPSEPCIMFECKDPFNPTGFAPCTIRYNNEGFDEVVLSCSSVATFSLYNCTNNEIIWSARIAGSGPIPNVVTHLDGHIIYASPVSNDVMVSCQAILPQ